MGPNEQKQQISIAYLRAVAATAGYKVNREEVDDDSLDVTIASSGAMRTCRSPQLGVQLKCTASFEWDGDEMTFRLPLKNYEDLRHTDFMVPRILVVLTVPKLVTDWLIPSDDYLAVHHCAYWVSLRGKPAYTGTSTDTKIAVTLTKNQRFTVEELKAIFVRIGAGQNP